MKQTVDITITADVPEDNDDLGHDAVVASREAVAAIVLALTTLGLANVRATRRLLKRKAPADTAVLPRAIPFKPAA